MFDGQTLTSDIPDIFESSWIRTVVFENELPNETGHINRGFAYGNLI